MTAASLWRLGCLKAYGAFDLTIRVAALTALLMLAGALGGCSKPVVTGAAADPNAGLDVQILNWRTEIVKSDPLCQSQVEDQKCTGFEVSCKAMRTITPDEAAKGMTSKLVAAMNWSGFDPKRKQTQPVVRTVQFSKIGSSWTRSDHGPVNPSTCADL